MEPEEIEEWRARLVARRDALLAEGDAKIEPNRRDPGSVPDEDEQPLNEMNQVIASQQNRRRVEELTRINGALRRRELDPEAFGECQECGELIASGRLELMPWALYCVRCQDRLAPRRAGHRRRHATDYFE